MRLPTFFLGFFLWCFLGAFFVNLTLFLVVRRLSILPGFLVFWLLMLSLTFLSTLLFIDDPNFLSSAFLSSAA